MTAIPTPAPVIGTSGTNVDPHRVFHCRLWHRGLGTAGALRQGPCPTQRRYAGPVAAVPGVGSIIAMPVAGALASRFGCRRVLSAGTILLCVALPMLATVSSIPLLMAGLFLFGAGLGTVDSTVNLQAVIVERASGKTMMSGFHGLFSLGGIVGAAGVSALLGLGLSPLSATLVVIVITLAALLKAAPICCPTAVKVPAPPSPSPRRGAVYRLPVFYRVPGRRCRARLERRVPQ